MCNCNSSFDIRARCSPSKDFKKCGARIDTMFFMIENDYECYKALESVNGNKVLITKIIKKFCSQNKLNSIHDKEKVINMYWEQQAQYLEEQERTSYC